MKRNKKIRLFKDSKTSAFIILLIFGCVFTIWFMYSVNCMLQYISKFPIDMTEQMKIPPIVCFDVNLK